MKFLTGLLILLMSFSAFAQTGWKDRDRYTDGFGTPYGGQNPPVFARNTNAHCMYSVWGCSGAGGSTNSRGFNPHRPPGFPGNPHWFQPGWGGGVPGWGNPCGSSQSVSGGAGVYNGQVSGSVTIAGSRGNCTPRGFNQQGGSVTLGVDPNGQVSGGVTFHESTSQ
jgi:hypothetical protein